MIFKDSKRRVTGITDKAADFKSDRPGIWHSVFNLGMFLVSMGSSLPISEMSMIPVLWYSESIRVCKLPVRIPDAH